MDYTERQKKQWETKRRNGTNIPWNKGIPLDDKTKKKISESKKGKPTNWKGKHHSEETRKKLSKIFKGDKRLGHKTKLLWQNPEYRKRMSDAHKGKKRSMESRKKQMGQLAKSNNPNWKGGITPENAKIRNSIEYNLWRQSVFARDNYTCQKCEDRGGKLRPHHIHNFADYPELRLAIDNGITLCDNCHKKFHKIYGKTKTNKEQLEEYINLQMGNEIAL